MGLNLLLPAMWRPKSCSGGSQAYTVSNLFLTSLIFSVCTTNIIMVHVFCLLHKFLTQCLLKFNILNPMWD